eukprot:3702171-Rhodomonas_salina.1
MGWKQIGWDEGGHLRRWLLCLQRCSPSTAAPASTSPCCPHARQPVFSSTPSPEERRTLSATQGGAVSNVARHSKQLQRR